jgi:hypothetical protein
MQVKIIKRYTDVVDSKDSPLPVRYEPLTIRNVSDKRGQELIDAGVAEIFEEAKPVDLTPPLKAEPKQKETKSKSKRRYKRKDK